MKKLTPVFCLFVMVSCSSQHQLITSDTVFNSHQQPYHIYSIGSWDTQHRVYTLVDAKNTFFTVKGNYNSALKKGDVYSLVN
jgi:uncharacterized protein YcfL